MSREDRQIEEDEDKLEARRMMKSAVRFGAVGLEMGIAVALGFLGGHWLDGKLGTDPVLGIVGLLLGAGAAGKAIWDAARKMREEEE